MMRKVTSGVSMPEKNHRLNDQCSASGSSRQRRRPEPSAQAGCASSSSNAYERHHSSAETSVHELQRVVAPRAPAASPRAPSRGSSCSPRPARRRCRPDRVRARDCARSGSSRRRRPAPSARSTATENARPERPGPARTRRPEWPPPEDATRAPSALPFCYHVSRQSSVVRRSVIGRQWNDGRRGCEWQLTTAP